ncbi:MAG: hypothetical protein MK102_16055 [Fuerstiella sp.]|nr:hypothetical protein [Fuerstiella sp.]
MSNPIAQQSTTLAHDPMGPRKLRYVIGILCIGPVLIWQLQNPYYTLAVRLVFAGLLLLGLTRCSAPLLLILIQLDLYLTVSTLYAVEDPPEPVISFFCVVLLMLLSRLRSSQELTGVRSIAQLLTSKVHTKRSSSEHAAPMGSDHRLQVAGSEILGVAARSLLLVLAAALMLAILTPDPSSVQEYGLTPSGMHTLSIGLILCAGYLIISLPFSEFHWRHLTPNQAGIYLRSRFIGWLHHDLRGIERRRRRHRRKQAHRHRRAQNHSYSTYSKEAD